MLHLVVQLLIRRGAYNQQPIRKIQNLANILLKSKPLGENILNEWLQTRGKCI